ATEYFERAVALDPKFALGYSGLANAYGAIYGNHYLPGNDVAMAEKSKVAADKALQLDDTLAEAYASRAAGFSSYYRDFAAAERDFRRAIELKPAYAPAHQWYSFHLWRVGRLAESRREAELAYQLEPFSRAMNATLCWNRKYERRYDEAIEFSRRAVQRDRNIVNYLCLFQVEALDGRYEDAIATIRAAPRDLDPSKADPLEIAYRQGGPSGFWRKCAELTSESEPYVNAEYHAMAGERDKAFAHLEIAMRRRSSELGGLRVDPMFDNLRSDPRYDELVRRIGLP
ncbi:MAG: hypothetical protein NDJ92_20290, partial [Thermoanaerobaculia bacterium]|nr:hypothetical protein [Thermoanaerobaculia bacterium]